jgi:hypothetical protein
MMLLTGPTGLFYSDDRREYRFYHHGVIVAKMTAWAVEIYGAAAWNQFYRKVLGLK